jgi:recombination protein RecT
MPMSTNLVALERSFEPLMPKFNEVLTHLTAARLIRSVLISCERNPVLLTVNRQSLYNAAMSAACLELECDGVTGQAFLIPFSGKAQLVIGYKGYVTLGARSGLTITGEVVRDGDDFDFDEGTSWVRHRKILGKPNRRIIASWAKAASMERPPVIKVLDIDDILAVKAKAPAAAKKDSPWNDPAIGFPAMAEKTAKRRLARSLPLNVMQTAARLDEAFEEEGRTGHINPAQGLVIEPANGTAAPPAAALLAHETPELELGPVGPAATDMLATYDTALAAASANGMAALERAWAGVPHAYRVTLKAALDRRHKPHAREIDHANTQSPAR